MSDNFDLTSANAVVILSVDELYPNGVQIQGFSTDSSFAVDDATIAEARMGVDGKLSAGYTPAPRTSHSSARCILQFQHLARNIHLLMACYRLVILSQMARRYLTLLTGLSFLRVANQQLSKYLIFI